MPLFLLERNFADAIDLSADDVLAVTRINSDVGVHWLHSFLSVDKRKSYCLYEAESAEAIREAARRANLPAEVVIAVSELRPELIAPSLAA